MSKSFNIGLNEDDKKEGWFKRLKDIEDKSEDRNKKIRYNQKYEHKFKTTKDNWFV